MAALALLLTACGSPGGSAAGDIEEPTAESAAEPAETTTPSTGPSVAPSVEVEPESPQPESDSTDPGGDVLTAIEAEFESWARFNLIPGAVLAVTLGDESLDVAYGVDDLVAESPMTTDAVFPIGSVTKTVTSAVILQLVDEGLVDLDETVSTYLPAWESDAEAVGAGGITVRQLLAHTAGFVDYAQDPDFYVEALPRLAVAIEPEEIVAFSLDQGLLFEPGSDYLYSTTNYLIAGLIIEAVTGNPAHVEFRNRVFEPLGATQLFLAPEESAAAPTVKGYVDLRTEIPDSDTAGLVELLATLVAVLPDEVVVEVDGGVVLDLEALPQEFLRSAGWTGGGLEGQASDTAKLLPGIFNSGMLSDAALVELTTPSEFSNRSVGVTIDDYSGYTVYSHGGSAPGYRSGVAYVPELDLSIAVQTNVLPLADDVHMLFASLAKLVADSAE